MRLAELAVVLALVLTPHTVAAQTSRTPLAAEAPHLTFAAAISLGLAVALTLGDPTPAPRWAGNPFDDAARDGLRLDELGARRAISLGSDVLAIGLIAFAAVLDGLVTPLVQDDPALAWQATAAYALALGVTLSVNELVKVAAARERPTDPGCDATPAPSSCTPHAQGMSFYSGHAATSFVSAGFSCAMHLERALYGDAVADVGACGGTLATAALVSVFRVMADQHYLSDVLVGAAVGFVTGYLAPLLFVPHRAAHDAHPSAASVVVLPTAAPSSLGVSALGTF